MGRLYAMEWGITHIHASEAKANTNAGGFLGGCCCLSRLNRPCK